MQVFYYVNVNKSHLANKPTFSRMTGAKNDGLDGNKSELPV